MSSRLRRVAATDTMACSDRVRHPRDRDAGVRAEHDVRAAVELSCRRQGLPVLVEDSVTLDRIAELLAPGQGGPVQRRNGSGRRPAA